MSSKKPTMPMTPEEWKARFSEAFDLLEQSGLDSDAIDEILVFVNEESASRLFPLESEDL